MSTQPRAWHSQWAEHLGAGSYDESKNLPGFLYSVYRPLKPAILSDAGACVEHVEVVGVDCFLLARDH